jgi:hypothetical protein
MAQGTPRSWSLAIQQEEPDYLKRLSLDAFVPYQQEVFKKSLRKLTSEFLHVDVQLTADHPSQRFDLLIW